MMKKQKKPYEKPCMQHFLVEAEDPICSGSAVVANPKDGGLGQIDAQGVNNEFASGGSFDASGSDNGWTVDNTTQQ